MRVLKRALEIKEGDLLDLQGDAYGENEMSPFEYARVMEVEHQNSECVLIHTEQGSFGFPPGHILKTQPRTLELEGVVEFYTEGRIGINPRDVRPSVILQDVLEGGDRVIVYVKELFPEEMVKPLFDIDDIVKGMIYREGEIADIMGEAYGIAEKYNGYDITTDNDHRSGSVYFKVRDKEYIISVLPAREGDGCELWLDYAE